jgi:hypothetical protein
MKTKTDMSLEAVTHRLNQMEGLWLLTKALADAKVERRNGGKNRSLEIQAAIREILLCNGKPPVNGRQDDHSVDRSHDQHIAPILRILVGSRSENDLVECLKKIGNDDGAQLQEMAKSLLELRVNLN